MCLKRLKMLLCIFLKTDYLNAIFNIFEMARMALTTDFKIPKLNGANYRDWTFNMRLYLESLDLFGHVDGSIGVPDEEASEQVKQEYKTASKKAWTYICLAVEPDQHVRNSC